LGKSSLKTELAVVRRYTGDKFTPAKGYDARRLNFGQRMAVLKYFNKIQQLTAKPFVEYTPRRGEKTEAFNYTGQKGYRAFTKAIVYHPDPTHKISFEVDKSLPKGSRFTVVDSGPKNAPRSPSRYFQIPARYFVANWEDYADTFEEYIQLILDEYAPGAELFLIKAGDGYMWGAGKGRSNLAAKLTELMQNYSAAFYDPNNKQSSYFGNWFQGVMAFTSRFDAFPAINRGLTVKREYAKRYRLPDVKFKTLSDGRMIGYSRGVRPGDEPGVVVIPPFYPERDDRPPPKPKKRKRR